ncbi:MAG: autotransporter outer membrane beta-barrel domain-containing protein [Hafnia sp.]
MNKIFIVKWNKCLLRFDVVSEKSVGLKKSKLKNSSLTNMLFIITMALSYITNSQAVELSVYNFKPEEKYTEKFIHGDNILSGSFSNISSGKDGYIGMTLGEAFDKNLLDADTNNLIKDDKSFFTIGTKNKNVTTKDPNTNNNITFNVYDNNNFKSTLISTSNAIISIPVGVDGQYVDRNLYQIFNGSNLNVEVGKKNKDWVKNGENYLYAILKNKNLNKKSSIFDLSSEQDETKLIYDSNSIIRLGSANNMLKDYISSSTVNIFVGKFKSLIGVQSVNNIEEFKKYNSELITALKDGRLNIKDYDAQLNLARDMRVYQFLPNSSVIDENDAVRALSGRDKISFITADGENSSVTVTESSNIHQVLSDSSIITLKNHASLVNNGSLSTSFNTLRGAYIVDLSDGSNFINNGSLNAGTNKDLIGETYSGTVINNSNYYAGVQAAISSDNATVSNEKTGVINLATSSSQLSNIGITLANSSVFINKGILNIAATPQVVTNSNPVTNGAVVKSKSTFNNDGIIYIGRGPQISVDNPSDDVFITSPTVGVNIQSNGILNNNSESNIIIGSKTSNAIALLAGSGSIVNQSGMININGTTSQTSILSNKGLVATAGTLAKNVVNSGTINLNGVNGIGVDVEANGQVTHSGVININGGFDPKTNYANYGLHVSGGKSKAVIYGGVNLFGNNSIGVYVENGGSVDFNNSGKLNFNTGIDQIGFLVYGEGSSIKNLSSNIQNVSADKSALYRIDGGANYNGSDNDQSTMKVSGSNSTIMLVTGKNSHLQSGKQSIDITGYNSTGVKVEGGGVGEISPDTNIIKVSGKNTVAGIVDNNYYDIIGNVISEKKGKSILTSYANLETANTADGAFGYIARNGGKLIHEGSIDFTEANSTGVLVDGAILDNRSTISVNGVAVNIQGASSEVTNTGTVTATDGTAAYLVGKDATLSLNGNGITQAAGSAHGILLDTGAKGLTVDGTTITMSDTGSGSAIENKANIVGIQLKDTTINVGNGIGVHTGASMAQTNSGTINVTGSGTGILFENIDVSQTDQTLDMSDSKDLVVNVQQAGGKGIVTNASSELKTGVSVNVLDSAGGAALIVKGSTQKVEQSGKLTSKSTTDAVVDINNGSVSEFVNRGDILALNASQVAIETISGSGVQFTNAHSGNITGQVNLLTGNNVVTLESGSTGTDFTTGSGSDLFLLKDIQESETNLFTSLNGGQGDDTLKLDNSSYVLNRDDAITGMEHIDLTNGSTLTLDNVLLTLGDSYNDSAATGYFIDSTSTLAVKNSTSVAFNSHLSGNGLMTVDTAGSQFEFTSNNAADGFAGTAAMGNTRFELDGLNTQALTNATMRADNGSIIHVGTGQQTIGGQAFNGGTVKFDGVTPGVTEAAGTIHTTDNMDLLGKGVVQVDAGNVSNDRPLPNTHVSLLEQDDTGSLIKLADSDATVQGSGGNLELHDASGNVISDGVTLDIVQEGTTAAKGTYNYRLTSGENNDGLYVNYGLTQVELLGSGNDALVLDANGKTGNAADLSAKITGSGDLAVDSQNGETVSLSNMDNDYTGVTNVRSGNLLILNDNVLGLTSELKLALDTVLDMNGYSQTVGKLATDAGSLLNINGGKLTLSQGGVSSGELAGSGELVVAADTLTVNGANANLSATTTIEQGALAELNNTLGLGIGDIVDKDELLLNKADGVLYNNISDNGAVALKDSHVVLAGDNSKLAGTFTIDSTSQLTAGSAQHLGTADIKDEGELVLNTQSDWELANNVTGSGSFTKQGSGSVTFNKNVAYTGTTGIQQGSLILGNENAPMTLASQQVNIHEGAKLSGFGGVAGNIDNQGLLQIGSDTPTDGKTQTFTIGKDLVNSGTVMVGNNTAHATAGNQLLVKGDYTGNDGHIHFNTALGDDNSVTDKMVVTGDTSGKTGVSISNAGGTGAQTLNGIELIHVDGTSNGEFNQEGRIVAGAYDYTLARGKDGNRGNWYLTSKQNGENQDPDPKPGENTERPEGGSYIANLVAANNLFVTRLHDRLGETQYIDALTGEQKVTSMWMRQVGGHNNWRDAAGQLKTQSNRYIMQMGGDVAQWSTDGLDRWHLGLMAGYGNNHSSTKSNISGYSSKGLIDGYSTGIYGTWYANDAEKTGAYLDSWLQYSWFNNHVNGEQIASESYKSRGITASVEVGQTIKINEFKGSLGSTNTWYVQPQAQAVWMGVKAKNHTEANGTRVSSDGDGNLMTRLGVRTYLKGHHASDEGKTREFQPFIEANWIHNTKDFTATMNGVAVKQDGARNLGEVKVGVEGQLNPRLNLWGNIGVQVGDKGYNDGAAMVGVKVNF